MMHRFPEGLAGDKVHQKRVPHGAPPWLETVRVHFPRYNRNADELCVTELGQRHLGRADEHGRVPPLEQPSRRHREAGRVADRPRPDAAVRLVARAARRPRRARGARRSGRGRLAEDHRRQGNARLRADQARARVQGRPPSRAGVCPRGGATRARRRHHHLVAQGPRPGCPVRRLQPERARPHDCGGLLGARRSRCAGVRAGALGRGRRRVPQDFTIETMPPGSPSSAICTRASTTPCSISRRSCSGPSATSMSSVTCRTRTRPTSDSPGTARASPSARP